MFVLVRPQEQNKLYSLITKDKQEFLEFEMAYSDFAEKTLRNNLMEMQLWTAAYAFAKKEMQTYQIVHKGKKQKLATILEENGYGALIKNNVGVITSTLLQRFNMLPWGKKDLRGKLLIPTFYTPFHIASLESCPWDDPTDMTSLFINDEKGWYGNLAHKEVVAGLFDIWATTGNTWDYKCDLWYPAEVINIGDDIDVSTCLRIWAEAKNTAFNISPLKKIVELGKADELQHYVADLNIDQLVAVEKETGKKLTDYWKKARETQVKIGGKVFVKRDNCYYTYRKGNVEQITNFSIDIEKIVKRGDKFYRIGMLNFGDKSCPFEMEEKYFNTNHMFHRGIKEKFLSSGLGVPLVYPAFFSKALLLIDSFNACKPIEIEEEVETEDQGLVLPQQ